MKFCTDCKRYLRKDEYRTCPDCGAIYCERCLEKNKKICPKCYSSID